MRAFARRGERGGSRGKRKRPRRMAKEVEDLVKVVVASREGKKSWHRRKCAGARWKYSLFLKSIKFENILATLLTTRLSKDECSNRSNNHLGRQTFFDFFRLD